jgi:hypothetical protein
MPSAARRDDIGSVPPVRRLLLVVLGALAFCATAGAAATGDPQYQVVQADQDWASSIVLGASDVGKGWRQSSNDGATDGSGSGSGDTACSSPDESDLIMTGGSSSPDFSRSDGAYISTSAIVWQTADQAQADWDRNVQPGLLSCLAAAAEASSTKKVKIVVAGRQQLTYPSLATRTAAYRLSLVFKTSVRVRKKVRKIAVRATYDFIAVGSGRATALMWAFSFDRSPLSDFNKQQWAMLMVHRMAVDPSAPR